jgi:hypothetical protein
MHDRDLSTAADAAPGDHFGYSVAISGDTAVVGAADHDLVGAAYVRTQGVSRY